MGKSCWRARLVIQQLFPIQILLVFLRFKLLPNFIFQCYRPQTCLLIFSCSFHFCVFTKCQVLHLRVGRSCGLFWSNALNSAAAMFFVSSPLRHTMFMKHHLNCPCCIATTATQTGIQKKEDKRRSTRKGPFDCKFCT